MSAFSILQLLEKPTVYFSTPIDVLILSCTIQRIGAEGITKYYSLDDPVLLSFVTETDHQKALAIRKHYSQLIICEKLKGNNLSQFRINLAEILSDQGIRNSENYRGIIYRLPDFYDFDIKLAELRETVFLNNPETLDYFQVHKSETLIPVCKMFRNVRSVKKHIYWFEILDKKTAAKIEIDKNNSLLNFWDDIFNLGQPLKISGEYSISCDQNLYSYKIKKWKINNFQLKK